MLQLGKIELTASKAVTQRDSEHNEHANVGPEALG